MSEEPKQHAPRGRIKASPMDGVDPMEGRCTATSKQSGQRCKRWPIPGGHVCVMHGGGSPLVKAKAEQRLAMLVAPAIARLGQLVDQREFPSVAIAAVKDVLDRNLGKPVENQNVDVTAKLIIEWQQGS